MNDQELTNNDLLECKEKFLPTNVIHSFIEPDLIFTTLKGEPIEPTDVIVDNNGLVDHIIDGYDEDNNPIVINRENFMIYSNFLHVPGVGYLRPGTFVVYDHKEEYQLFYGWHTNISNQTIYSWYLNPLNKFGKERKPRTLYKEMIDKIDLICFYGKGGIYEGYKGQ